MRCKMKTCWTAPLHQTALYSPSVDQSVFMSGNRYNNVNRKREMWESASAASEAVCLSIGSNRVKRRDGRDHCTANTAAWPCALTAISPPYHCSLKVCMWGVITAFFDSASLEANRTSCLIKRNQLLFAVPGGAWRQTTFYNTMQYGSHPRYFCGALSLHVSG